jgi:hypothetical protein
MKKTFASLAAAAALLVGATGAQAVVLTFDDLGPGRVYLDQYGGLDFNPDGLANSSDWFVTDTPDPFNPPASNPSYVGTACGAAVFVQPASACGVANVDSDRVVGLTPFKLNSVFLGGSDPVQIPPDPFLPLAVTFKLYDATNTLVATEAFSVNTGVGPSQQFNFTYTGFVSSFIVTSKQGFYALDNLDITPIPEAGTLAMMLVGMGAIGAAVRRRQAR